LPKTFEVLFWRKRTFTSRVVWFRIRTALKIQMTRSNRLFFASTGFRFLLFGWFLQKNDQIVIAHWIRLSKRNGYFTQWNAFTLINHIIFWIKHLLLMRIQFLLSSLVHLFAVRIIYPLIARKYQEKGFFISLESLRKDRYFYWQRRRVNDSLFGRLISII